VTIPANSYHSVTLSGTPLEDGLLVVKGYHVQAPGGASREFLLSLATAEDEERRSCRRTAVACESGRTKYVGLDSRPGKYGKRNSTLVTSSSSKRVIPNFLECTVVPEQPLLRMRWSSLTHGAIMLYNGEKCGFRSPTMTPAVADVWQVYTSANTRKYLKFACRLSKAII
jgi:trafficking protein particle complex subunit 9